MNFTDWYTDTMDIYRTVPTTTGNLTTNERQQLESGIPCRIYQSEAKAIDMRQQAAGISQTMKLMCQNAVDVRTGDELYIHRGGRLGKTVEIIRAFAGDVNHYYEPFGAVIPGLAHKEIRLKQQEVVKLEPQAESGAASQN